jgi:aminoglycoside phosphotransferase (APT) family kinase protein
MQRPAPRTGSNVTSPAAGRLLASGRDCDIFGYAPGLVLRRSRHGRMLDREARVMEYARRHGYPVPAIKRVSGDGTELVMERIDGPSMVGAIERRPWTVRQLGTQLAALHRRLHDIPAPDFVPAFPLGDGDRLLHLDLHPLNVIIGPAGPVVIDWAGAASGDPALDVGIAWLLMAAGEVPAAVWKRPLTAWARARLVSSFLAGAGVSSVMTYLPALVEWKSADANMTAGEIARMRAVLDGAGAAGVSGHRAPYRTGQPHPGNPPG